jgi:hypothetical protein
VTGRLLESLGNVNCSKLAYTLTLHRHYSPKQTISNPNHARTCNLLCNSNLISLLSVCFRVCVGQVEECTAINPHSKHSLQQNMAVSSISISLVAASGDSHIRAFLLSHYLAPESHSLDSFAFAFSSASLLIATASRTVAPFRPYNNLFPLDSSR